MIWSMIQDVRCSIEHRIFPSLYRFISCKTQDSWSLISKWTWHDLDMQGLWCNVKLFETLVVVVIYIILFVSRYEGSNLTRLDSQALGRTHRWSGGDGCGPRPPGWMGCYPRPGGAPAGAAGSDDGREERWPRPRGWSVRPSPGLLQRWSLPQAGLTMASHRFPNHWGTLPGIAAAGDGAGYVPGAGGGGFRSHPAWSARSAPDPGGPESPGVRSCSRLSLD